jgi:hypothetical protein
MSSNSSQATNAPSGDYETRIRGMDLPEEVLEHVERYEAVAGDRDRFVWKWIYSLLPSFRLSSVPQERTGSVRILKTELTILITLLDDLAEKHGDTATFESVWRCIERREAGEIPDAADEAVVAFADDLWSEIEAGVVDAPRHDEMREVFEYDLRQALNAMDYSRMLNDHLAMANLAGTEHYGPHNMVMFPYADIDIMYSPSFEFGDLGKVRELIWHLQKMARIGNWLTTWEREIREGDFTAGIVVHALQNRVISFEELEGSDARKREELVERIKQRGIEDRFMSEWWRRHRAIREADYRADSVDLSAFVTGMETVMEHHLASQGFK